MAAVISAQAICRGLPAVAAKRASNAARVTPVNTFRIARNNARVGVVVRADAEQKPLSSTSSIDGSVDGEKLLKDLQEKWDAVENKGSVAIYGGASIVSIWVASAILSAVDSIPLVPKVLELIGLVYTSWFVYRYLLFKSSREELITDVDELKKKISGTE